MFQFLQFIFSKCEIMISRLENKKEIFIATSSTTNFS
jgi:hypothetical protein